MEPGLEATYVYDPPNFSLAVRRAHRVVEVDTETGAVELVRYVAVDDVGNVDQPDDRRRPGARRHRAGRRAGALGGGGLRRGRQPPDRARLVNYLVPSAAELPSFELDRTETPSPTNPLGVKGVGETGTIASTPAVMNAVVDALAPFGVTDIECPRRRSECGARSRRSRA